MNKRQAARQARINEVLMHKDITDLSEELSQLHKMKANEDLFYTMNVRHAFSLLDPACLTNHGWQQESSSQYGTTLFIHKLRGNKKKLSLYLSSDNRWLVLRPQKTSYGAHSSSARPETEIFLNSHLLPGILQPGPESVEKEIALCRAQCPPLFTARGKRINPQEEYGSSLWTRIMYHWLDNDIAHAQGHVFSMMRHITPAAPSMVWLALPLSAFAIRLNAPLAFQATVCLLLLEHTPDGCICTHYHSIGFILHRLGFHQAALYCANITWLYTQTPYILDFSDIKPCMEDAAKQLISRNRLSEIPDILKAADYCLSKLHFPELLLSVTYLRGLLAAHDKRWQETAAIFEELKRTISELEADCSTFMHASALRNTAEECLSHAKHNSAAQCKKPDSFFSALLGQYPIIPV